MTIPKNQSGPELLFDVELEQSHLLLGVAEESAEKFNQSFASNLVKQSR